MKAVIASTSIFAKIALKSRFSIIVSAPFIKVVITDYSVAIITYRERKINEILKNINEYY